LFCALPAKGREMRLQPGRGRSDTRKGDPSWGCLGRGSASPAAGSQLAAALVVSSSPWHSEDFSAPVFDRNTVVLGALGVYSWLLVVGSVQGCRRRGSALCSSSLCSCHGLGAVLCLPAPHLNADFHSTASWLS